MGSGDISLIFIISMVGIMACGFIWSMVTLIYKSIDEHEFNPVSFWLSIAFLLVLIFSIFAVVDIVKYDNRHVLKTPSETALSTDYKEIKTFDVYIKNGETYLNAKNATIKGQGYISFDTEDGRHLETNAEAVVEVHTEIIKE